MNTQRPEWNDANNALVGNGVSVVTLFHLQRHLEFLREVFDAARDTTVPLSAEVARWLGEVGSALRAADASDAGARMALLCMLGEAFSRYRERVYAAGLGRPELVALADVRSMLDAALAHLHHALDGARRDDGLYHSYDLLELDLGRRTLHVHTLDAMLEGQVAALGSGHATPAEAVSLLDALFASPLYLSDQMSFLLYPARELPDFLERNIIPTERARTVELIDRLLATNDRSIVVSDVTGAVRFHPDFGHAGDLTEALDTLALRPGWRDPVARDRAAMLEVYEDVFHHRAFTGRSGRMYGYEGIGSVYWHMVAKLLLAVQETHARALGEGAPDSVVAALAAHYHRVRAGFGFMRSAESYGAFPTDPYSHTPAHAGAQQPGMSGQVKEEILARFGELGVTVKHGQVAFRPRLLPRSEFLSVSSSLEHVRHGAIERIPVPAGCLGFTYAGTPVLYRLTRGESWVRVMGREGSERRLACDTLDRGMSRALLSREGSIVRIEVGIPEAILAAPKLEEAWTA
jgi:hypothetical protein